MVLLFLSLVLADGQAPTFMPIEPNEDFYGGSDLYLEVQISDQSSIEDVFLYYRFSSEKSFSNIPMKKEIFYSGVIPGINVLAGRMEYYFFARDEHGNQSTWPSEGEDLPESLPIFEPLLFSGSDKDISIDLLNPIPDEISEEASIIILTLYNPEGAIDLDNIRLMIDDEDVSEFIYKSIDMVTFVPNEPLTSGKHEIEFQLVDDEGVYLKKKFKFTLSEIDLSFAEKFNWREKLNFKGNISYNSDYDEFFGKDRPKNRPGDSHKLNTSLKFSFGRTKVKTSALFNTHFMDKDALEALDRRQPVDRLKFGVTSPLLDFRYGDFTAEYSELTLKGTRIRGIYSKLKLGPWHSSYVSGNTKELIDPITDENADSTSWAQVIDSSNSDTLFVNHTKGTASRKMNAVRTELAFSKVNFGLSALSSFDDVDAFYLPYEDLYDQYTFLGNAVFGTDFTLLLNNKKTQFKAETAISLMNDLRGSPIDSIAESLDMPQDELDMTNEILGSIENIVGFNINSDLIIGSSQGRGISVPLPNMDSLDVADYIKNDLLKRGTYRLTFKTPINYKENNVDIQAEYKRIPSNFVSLGNSSIQTDIQGLKSSVKARLLNNKLSFNIGYDNEHDNLMGDKPEQKLKSATTTSLTSSAGFGLSIPKIPSVNYSIRLMDREGISVEDKMKTASNKTVTHTFNPAYKFDTDMDLNVNMNGNIMYMIYTDNLFDPVTAPQNPNFITESYTGALSFRFESPLTVNFGGGLSKNTPEDPSQMPTQFLVLTSKVGYKFWEKMLSTYIGLNIVNGGKNADANGDGKIDNFKLTVKSGAQYKIAQNISLGLNVDFLSLSDKVTSSNDYTEIKGKLKLKIGF